MEEEKVILMLLNHRDRLDRIEENMVKREDHNVVVDFMDQILGIVKRTEQEVIMIRHGLSRHGETLDKYNKDLKELKTMNSLI